MRPHDRPGVPPASRPPAAARAAVLLAIAAAVSQVTAADAPYEFERVLTVAGPCCTDMGVDLVVDDNDSVLVTGRRGGLDLDRDGTVDLDTHGTPDTLVFMSHDGNQSGWIVGPGGPKEDQGNAIASDRDGGAFVVGSFMDRLDLGATAVSGHGKRDGFLTRFEAAEIVEKGRMLMELKRTAALPELLSKKERKGLRKLYRRELVKRSLFMRIVAAWLITVPASAVSLAGSWKSCM